MLSVAVDLRVAVEARLPCKGFALLGRARGPE